MNPTGPLTLVATITNSSQHDPNLANNTAAPPPVNRPPVANAGADQAVATGATVTLNGAGSGDSDGDTIAFQWAFTLRPANSTATLIGATTAAPTFLTDLPGSYNAQLTVTDSQGIASITDTVAVAASGPSQQPVIKSAPITTGFVGVPYRYDVDAIDPDQGDTLTYSLTAAPAGMVIGPTTGVIDWTPGVTQGGSHPVLVRVQDHLGLSAFQGFAVQVSSTSNRAPAAVDDAFEARVNASLSVTPVLNNDVDPDGSPLKSVLKPPANGTLNIGTDRSFIHTAYAAGRERSY